MSELTSEQFKAAVAAAIFGVEHLYREVDLLIASLREALAEEPEPLTLKRGTLGKSKRVVVKYEYGALFEPAVDDDDAADDDEEGDEDDEPEEPPADTAKKGKSKRHEVVAGQPLLAVRIAMYDPRKRGAFEPQIQFGVMDDWALGDLTSQPEDRFTLQSYMLKRISRALSDHVGVAKGTRIRTAAAARPANGPRKGKDRRLTCLVPAGVEAVSLYSIVNADQLERVADRMKEMWGAVAV